MRRHDRQRHPAICRTASWIIALLAAVDARTFFIHSCLTDSPACAARWAMTLAPSTLVEVCANSSNRSGAATSAPIRRPASPSHFEKLSMATEPSG